MSTYHIIISAVLTAVTTKSARSPQCAGPPAVAVVTTVSAELMIL